MNYPLRIYDTCPRCGDRGSPPIFGGIPGIMVCEDCSMYAHAANQRGERLLSIEEQRKLHQDRQQAHKRIIDNMNALPPPPKGYLIAERGALVGHQSRPILWLSKSRKWLEYPLTKLRLCDWDYNFWHDPPGGPHYAIPKPRYTCPLEFSRYVSDALESLL